MLLEVLRRSADNTIDRRELARHHVWRQFPRDANREIVAFFRQLEKTVADGEINLYNLAGTVNVIGDVLKQLSVTPKEKSSNKDLPKSKDQ